jgi:1-acyl-sn-glycerol-3-phosphate acyltransferase
MNMVNLNCVCGKNVCLSDKQIIVSVPCNHIFHKNCVQNIGCPFCNSDVYVVNHNNNMFVQKFIDNLSLTKYENTNIIIHRILFNIPKILDILLKRIFMKTIDDVVSLNRKILSLSRIKITIDGLDNLEKIHGNRIYIANHSSYLDSFVLFDMLRTGFVSNSATSNNIFMKKIYQIVPNVLVKRSYSGSNTVDKIKNHVEKYGSVCIFPEGRITHPQTLISFRTGAFTAGFPIIPIVITYNNCIADYSYIKFMLKLASNHKTDVQIYVLEPEYPPFDNIKINHIRNKMAERGNLFLATTTNRDIKD